MPAFVQCFSGCSGSLPAVPHASYMAVAFYPNRYARAERFEFLSGNREFCRPVSALSDDKCVVAHMSMRTSSGTEREHIRTQSGIARGQRQDMASPRRAGDEADHS